MTDTADFKANGAQKACFANASISNPWRQTGWITMNQQLKELQDKGVISEMETRDAGDDDNTQIADIDYFISEGDCDAFIVSPNSTAAMTAGGRAGLRDRQARRRVRPRRGDRLRHHLHPPDRRLRVGHRHRRVPHRQPRGGRQGRRAAHPARRRRARDTAGRLPRSSSRRTASRRSTTSPAPTRPRSRRSSPTSSARARSTASGWTPVTAPSPPSRPSRTSASTTRS